MHAACKSSFLALMYLMALCVYCVLLVVSKVGRARSTDSHEIKGYDLNCNGDLKKKLSKFV